MGNNGGRGGLVVQTVKLEQGSGLNVTVGTGGAGGISSTSTTNNPDAERTLTTYGGNGGSSSAGSIVAQGGKNDGTSYGNGGAGGVAGYANSRNVKSGTAGSSGWVEIESLDNVSITPSGLSDEIALTSNKNIFSASDVGSYMQIIHKMPGKTVSTSNGTTNEVLAGDGWKIVSHGTWTGTLEVQYRDATGQWKEYRKYTSKNDFNPSESGTVTEPTYLRAIASVSSGTCSADLTRMPYDHTGVVKITQYISPTKDKGKVLKELGSTDSTTEFCWGAWSNANGYPQTVCFFQDRLCFGGNTKEPYKIWMSRSGDYGNFGVEKADGSVTDDSAVAAAFVSRKQFQILHLVPSTDLLVMSEGNEWIVSGSEVVTPKNITPKMQTTHGSSKVDPQMIGGRLIYVQGRGSVVRDMGYSFETDSYGGTDLTLLAKHLIRNADIVDVTYQQNPDSICYFVMQDGTINCLAYIREQEVYAWSHLETAGEVESIEIVGEGDNDAIYAVVKRTINGEVVRNIERFADLIESSDPDDYVMLDSAIVLTSDGGTDTFNASHLAGMTVEVVGDGRMFKNIVVGTDGVLTLPAKVQHAVIGLPYSMKIELPNVEIKNSDGTIQGRYKQVSGCTLRLQNSLGGTVGPTFSVMDRVQYDEMSAVKDIQLYTGDKKIVLPIGPIGGFNLEGRLCIENDDPYPFNLLAVIREVSFGG